MIARSNPLRFLVADQSWSGRQLRSAARVAAGFLNAQWPAPHHPAHFLLACCVVACGCVTIGCGGGTSESDGPKVTQRKDVAADHLKWGDHLPPLDDGRIELAGPQDWRVVSRNPDYVARFSLDKTARFPRIWITASDEAPDGITNVDASNVERFATWVAQRLADEGVDLDEQVKPMTIGGRACARYVRSSAFASPGKARITTNRQILETLIDGRRYTIDLQVPRGTIRKYRDAGYAVMASIRKPQAAAPPPPGESSSPPAE